MNGIGRMQPKRAETMGYQYELTGRLRFSGYAKSYPATLRNYAEVNAVTRRTSPR